MRRPGSRLLVTGCLAGALAVWAQPSPSRADTTVPITGIGTTVGAINTHVESVRFSGPRVVFIARFGEAVEIRGTVSGVGWGGGGIIGRASSAHYNYQIPFVARWPRTQTNGRNLVFHNHGGGVTLLVAIQREKIDGESNVNRRTEFTSDASVGLPALLNQCVYISTNRRGLRGDGTFSATYLPAEIPPLTQGEADALNATIAGYPGTSGFQQPGIAAGAPVPLVPSTDAPTCRDIARALQLVVPRVMGASLQSRICSGQSSGSALGGAIDFGRSAIGPLSVRTGGNHAVPYDLRSPRIFDGFLFTGFFYNSDAERADLEFPISAPAFFIQGRADERYQQTIRMAHELLQKGVPLNRAIRVYEVMGMTHITRDIKYDTPQPATGEAQGCYVSAAIGNMIALLREGREPPVSRIAGRLQDGALVIDQANGLTTTFAPILEDPSIDTLLPDMLVVPRTIGPAETQYWIAVTAALAHEDNAIASPSTLCRVGGYGIRFTAPDLAPFTPEALAALYGNFRGYTTRVADVVNGLKGARLYDDRVESAQETADFSSGLFRR